MSLFGGSRADRAADGGLRRGQEGDFRADGQTARRFALSVIDTVLALNRSVATAISTQIGLIAAIWVPIALVSGRKLA